MIGLPEVFVVVMLRLEVLVVVVVVDALRAKVADDGLVQLDAPPVVPLQLLDRKLLLARRARRRRLRGAVALVRGCRSSEQESVGHMVSRGLHSGRKLMIMKCEQK